MAMILPLSTPEPVGPNVPGPPWPAAGRAGAAECGGGAGCDGADGVRRVGAAAGGEGDGRSDGDGEGDGAGEGAAEDRPPLGIVAGACAAPDPDGSAPGVLAQAARTQAATSTGSPMLVHRPAVTKG